MIAWAVTLGYLAVMALVFGVAAYRSWRERAAIELRHRWGRDCPGEWVQTDDYLVVRCTRCGVRHEVWDAAAREALARDRMMALVLREATAAGTLDLWRERAS